MSKVKTLQIRMDDDLSNKWNSVCTAQEHKYLSSAGVLDSLLDSWPVSEASRAWLGFMHDLLPHLNLEESSLPPSMHGKFKVENGFLWRNRFDPIASEISGAHCFEWTKMLKLKK